jgi:hypothetical protein
LTSEKPDLDRFSDPSRYGNISIRHPVYDIHPEALAGLPEEIIACIANNSYESDHLKQSKECLLVNKADITAWELSAQVSLIDPEAILDTEKKVIKYNPCPLKTKRVCMAPFKTIEAQQQRLDAQYAQLTQQKKALQTLRKLG